MSGAPVTRGRARQKHSAARCAPSRDNAQVLTTGTTLLQAHSVGDEGLADLADQVHPAGEHLAGL